LFQTLLNEAAKIERSEALRATPYERAPERTGYANGFKDKTIHTRMGALKVKIPQVRGLEFYPGCIEKGNRSERALKLAIAEMYVQGVSTRKVQKITEELCGFQISSTQVSNLSKLLDEELEQFRNRPLGRYKYVYLDALYEKVRHQGLVRDWAVLIATGVNEDGKREIIGISTSLSEAEVHWRCFLENLCGRGLSGVELIISDEHAGLKKARKAVLPAVKFQRCYFHLAQNAQHYFPQKSMIGEVADAVREIFNETSLEDAGQRLKRVAERYQEKAPKFAEWLEQNAPESFTYFNFPKEHWRKIRTNNNQERLNKEIRRRTRVVSIFPNEAACTRLITAVLQEMHKDWSTGKIYLKI
jgi:transposase-like protein